MNEMLIMSGKEHRTPQNDKVDGRDCHVALLLATMEQEKNQIPLTLFAKGGIFSITPLMKEVQSEGTPIFILTAQ
ncbi:MAG: hypothetical protein BWY41_00556 [Candidatus Atribacteria bacterium ADurb.Bin276]|jgi:hypothetical protein|uniref:Uncharacterized protein n=1 Tax=Candidatus Atribacter allofermentans TaxID=1852833 RepID=A0A1V5T1Q1_9BACT|nr:MAG: hypothetical protein BWY41_00556 [Candidatus Atribacteria bacterium ADurb.Bin276]